MRYVSDNSAALACPAHTPSALRFNVRVFRSVLALGGRLITVP
jgi:hypothetical protein